jgi:hypothetical protein
MLEEEITMNIGGGRLWCLLEVEGHVVCWRKKIKVCFRVGK